MANPKYHTSEQPPCAEEIGATILKAIPLLVAALSTTSSRPSARDALAFIVEEVHTIFDSNALPVMISITEHLSTLVATVASDGCRSDRGRAAPLLTSIATITGEAIDKCNSLVSRVELAQLISALLEHVPHRGATYATSVAEALMSVNCEPVKSRCRELGPEMFVAAAERILPEAMFPDGFTRWEEMDLPDGDDELGDSEFAKFREQYVSTMLQIAYDSAGFGCVLRLFSSFSSRCVTWLLISDWNLQYVMLLDSAGFERSAVAMHDSPSLGHVYISVMVISCSVSKILYSKCLQYALVRSYV
jgi:hypothetical protein